MTNFNRIICFIALLNCDVMKFQTEEPGSTKGAQEIKFQFLKEMSNTQTSSILGQT